MPSFWSDKRVVVTGGAGFLGSFVADQLRAKGCEQIVVPRSRDYDLVQMDAVKQLYSDAKPDLVIRLAARVGGICANQNSPAEFLYDNVTMAVNAIHAAYENSVERFLFLGSTCIYPREATQPMREDVLLTSPLEPTNEAYALAKITGLKMCQAYRRQYGV